ncbi:hypothetical protein [Nocardioides sp. URHA0020]|uniref:hypothetical protein n=1 Tax=Nocardioides sp. URHA0020 TaxID=1380392 RepID=UPI00048D3765|nr:hypothetical protein [Nocardioides sp. URHA0020]
MRRRDAVHLVLVVVALAALGALAGAVWQWLWTPTMGVVVDHRWTAGDAIGLQHEFAGTGWYVAIGTVAGLVAGVAAALLVDRQPLGTLAAVLVGSVLGAWLMVVVGTALGPADPTVLARTAADGTRLPMQLSVSGHGPLIAYPGGALLGLMVVFVGLSARTRPDRSEGQPHTSPESPTDVGVAG